MLPILTARQIQEQDIKTIKQEPIFSIDLMERAAKALVNEIKQRFKPQAIVIICGRGNNGGDGLAVARMLFQDSWNVQLFCPVDREGSKDFRINLKRCQDLGLKPQPLEAFDSIEPTPIYIDALLGTGLDREVTGFYSNLIGQINAKQGYKISIDMPSGCPSEPIWPLNINNCVQADLVLSLAYPKLSLLLPYVSTFVKEFICLDIGLVPFVGKAANVLLEKKDIKSKWRTKDRFTHKYKEGKVLLCGGSKGMSGSIVLSCEAAFRTGSGLVQALIPKEVVKPLTAYLPEAMYSVSGKSHLGSIPRSINKVSAVGIGPGLGRSARLKKVLVQAMHLNCPLIIDADALHIIAEHHLIDKLPKESILTPHEGEFRALVGSWTDEGHKLNLLRDFSNKNKLIVVLKGAYTAICDGSTIFFNSSGHQAMATAGSGDVLLGVISSLRGQGYSALDAAMVGVYLHGLSAELYLNENNSSSLLARDIARGMGAAIARIEQS